MGENYRMYSEPEDSPSPDKGLSELTLRIITAAIGVPAITVAIVLSFWGVAVMAIIVAAIVGMETRDMADGATEKTRRWTLTALAGAIVAAAAVVLAWQAPESLDITALALVFIGLVLLIEIVVLRRYRRAAIARRNSVLAYGAIVVLAVAMTPFIMKLENGRGFMMWGVLVVFAADTGAFFVGRSLGRRKLAPSISPGKTWEGLLGGIIVALIASWLISLYPPFGLEMKLIHVLPAAFAMAVIGAIGDLGESWIKRLAEVKDSGGTVPGHGGVMDRLDSLAPNFVFLYFLGTWIL